jgi:hypothetical protein
MSGRPRGEQGFALVEISSIVLDTTSLAATDSTYRADSAYSASQAPRRAAR